jgi:hypothetical protein
MDHTNEPRLVFASDFGPGTLPTRIPLAWHLNTAVLTRKRMDTPDKPALTHEHNHEQGKKSIDEGLAASSQPLMSDNWKQLIRCPKQISSSHAGQTVLRKQAQSHSRDQLQVIATFDKHACQTLVPYTSHITADLNRGIHESPHGPSPELVGRPGCG